MSALNAVATAISDLDEEGYPIDDLGEALEAFAELIEASSRVASHGTRSARQINADWDRLRAVLTRVKGGAA